MIPIIIIPAYNPPFYFIKLLEDIRNITNIPIIVIDDGSQPKIKIKPTIDRLTLSRNKNNEGKGYSLLKAFNLSLKNGYTHAITMDADSQHDPSLISKFLSVNENIIIVCGNRDFNSGMPFIRKLSNVITSKIISLLCSKIILDSQCGYRRYRLESICKKTYLENGFQFETEVLIKILKKKRSVVHVSIPTIYGYESSSMHYFYDTLKFIQLIIRHLCKLS